MEGGIMQFASAPIGSVSPKTWLPLIRNAVMSVHLMDGVATDAAGAISAVLLTQSNNGVECSVEEELGTSLW